MNNKKKQKNKQRNPRVVCSVCMKPNATMYYGNHKRKDGTPYQTLFYLHRDEDPIKTVQYYNRDYKVYRRCDAGIVTTGMFDPQKTTTIPAVTETPGPDYQKLYLNLIQELHNIVYDLEGDTAIRMIKNIRRMLGQTVKQK